MSARQVHHVFSVEIFGGSESVVIDNNDLVQLYFVEDIYSLLLTGKMIIIDNRGLHEFLPIVGDENIRITYGSIVNPNDPHDLKVLDFETYKIGDIENTEERNRKVIEIFFTEKQHKLLHHYNCSASWVCRPYTDIIKEIGEIQAGFEWAHFEDCEEIKDYYYNGLLSPAQDMKWLSERCSSVVSGEPGFLIYSDTLNIGMKNLASLEYLLAMSPRLPRLTLDDVYTVIAHHEYNINNIIKYRIHRGDKNSLGSLMRGFNLGFDIRRKKHFKNEYSYTEGLDRYTCLGEYSLFNEDRDFIEFNDQILTGEHDEEYVMKNMFWGEWIKRYSLQQTVSVVMEGHSLRHCGGVIEIVWPSSDENQPFDKQMVGLYLVKSITHNFVPSNQPMYTQKMELIKNGYHDTDGTLTPAGKIRLSTKEVKEGKDLNLIFDNKISIS